MMTSQMTIALALTALTTGNETLSRYQAQQEYLLLYLSSMFMWLSLCAHVFYNALKNNPHCACVLVG